MYIVYVYLLYSLFQNSARCVKQTRAFYIRKNRDVIFSIIFILFYFILLCIYIYSVSVKKPNTFE